MTRMPKTLIISQRLPLTDARYFKSSRCAPETLLIFRLACNWTSAFRIGLLGYVRRVGIDPLHRLALLRHHGR